MPATSASALFLITFDPFKPHKTTEITLTEAHDRGFETIVAMDDRSTVHDRIRLSEFADIVVPFPGGMTENGYRVMRYIRSEFALILADDEQPSDPLWDFAARPPSPNRFGIPVIPVLGDRMYEPDIGIQERLVWMEGFKFNGGFEGSFSGAPQVWLDRNPGVLIWHYDLEAPRAEREAKAARYTSYDPHTDHRARLIWEEHPDRLVPIPGYLKKYLPEVLHA